MIPEADASLLDAGSDAIAYVCGAGTYAADGGVCLPLSGAGDCPDGSANLGGFCLPTTSGGPPSFAVYGPSSTPADGYSATPILAIGPVDDAGAGPAIVLAVTPALGTIREPSLSLTSTGASTYYVPCDSLDPACTGTVRITLALASAPETILATSAPIALTRPTGVGSDAPCLVGGDVLFLNGDPGDYIHPGMETFSNGSWSFTGGARTTTVGATPPNGTVGSGYQVTFSTAGLDADLAPQVYVGATRAPFASTGPGLEISGDGRGCNTLTGSFQIEAMSVDDGGALTAITATFEQHCEGASAALRGCVHYAP